MFQTFVVEVIQFRNAFDAQGPAVPGISPSEAVTRLHDFQQRYALYDAKRKTLDSVSQLFGIVGKPFPELDKTGEVIECSLILNFDIAYALLCHVSWSSNINVHSKKMSVFNSHKLT